MPGRIPSNFIDDLLVKSDIVEVIGRFVPLQKKGREFMACCPFHDEKTPSFSVNPNKQFYYCFGCGAGGSAIQFLMKYQNLDFILAVETLAQYAGLEVPREGGDRPAAENAQRKRILAMLAKASEFYRKNLARAPSVGGYLTQRGIDENTATAFDLGYAPDGYDNLKRFFGADYDEALLLKAGLVSQKESTRHTYDKFRDRLMFPIRDRQGHTIAFGGRVLQGDAQPKYLNSPETEVFHKRRTLYGAWELRETRGFDEILVVEGYMDVVSLAAHGVKNAVATLGTAVTNDHMQQLFRLCDQLVFCFDGDAAGRKAAVLALEQALALFHDGRTVKFLFLPEGEDPDSFVKAHGREAMQKAVTEATPLSVFMFDHLREALDLSLPEQRATFAQRARGLLEKLPRGAFRDLVAAELADKAGVETAHLLSAAAPKAREWRTPQSVGRHKPRYSAVRIAIAALLADPTLAAEALPFDEIRTINRPGTELLADLLALIAQTPGITTAAILERYRDSEHEKPLMSMLDWLPTPDASAKSSATSPEKASTKPQAEPKTEFKHAMQHLHKLSQEQAFESLVKKSQEQELSEEEKKELQELLSQLGG